MIASDFVFWLTLIQFANNVKMLKAIFKHDKFLSFFIPLISAANSSLPELCLPHFLHDLRVNLLAAQAHHLTKEPWKRSQAAVF